MALDTKAADAMSLTKAPLEGAFSGSGFFYPLNEGNNFKNNFRKAFHEPGVRMGHPADATWQSHFDKFYQLAYEEIGGVLKGKIYENLENWMNIRSKVETLRQEVASAEYDDLKDSVGMQQRVVRLYKDAIDLTKKVREHTDAMRGSGDSLKRGIDELGSLVETLKRCWVDFAQEMSKDNDSKLPRSIDWFNCLLLWSDLMEMCDNALPLLRRTAERYESLYENMSSRLPTLLGELPAICFDLYGNLLTGTWSEVRADSASLRTFGDKLRAWADSCPTWDRGERYSVQKRVSSGQIYHNRDGRHEIWGADPNSVNVSREEDIQVGITRLDASNKKATGLQLNVGDSHKADRYWGPRGDTELFDTRLSWIQIPDKLREHVQFSYTTYEGNYRVTAPGAGDQTVSFFQDGKNLKSTNWIVKFPRPFASDNVVVRPWIMDMSIQGGSSTGVGAIVSADEITRETFRVHFQMPPRSGVSYMRIAFMAYEASSPIDGFHSDVFDVYVPNRERAQPPPHNYKPYFIPFPQGKFKRRPAYAAMASEIWINNAWYQRADLRYAATRDGIVLQFHSWHDTIVFSMRFEILAISND